MNEKKLTDTARAGEVIIVRRPHTLNVKLYWYCDVDAAFDAWENDGIFTKYENYENYLAENGISNESQMEEVKKELLDAGIGLNSSFVEFSPSISRDTEFYSWNGSKIPFLCGIIEYDMYAAGIFIAEDGETYAEFVDRIFDGTRGHNEPTREHIISELGLENE